MSGLHSDYHGIVRWLHTESNANRNGEHYSFGNTKRNSDADRHGETFAYTTDTADAKAASHSRAEALRHWSARSYRNRST